MSANILAVDDDAVIRRLLAIAMRDAGHNFSEVADLTRLKQIYGEMLPDIVLLDVQLPDGNGLDALPEIKRHWPSAEVIVLTMHATFDIAVEAIKRGAFHFAQKPFESEALLLLIDRALEHRELKEEADSLRRALAGMSGSGTPIFQSMAMKQVLRTVERIAPSDVSILIVGESGVGKEVITDLIHAVSPRVKGPLVKVNCAALPRELIESELFGSVKGAFTGALTNRDGLFRQAEGGTLLLDEISEMPIDTQSKLLRVLQEKEVRPVGGTTSYKTNCRVVAATNRKVQEAIKDGKLREDLYYRISAITLTLPPLRERREDIVPMAEAFMKRFSAQAGRPILGFSPEVRETLRAYDWPGNVRQLQNEIQRAVLLCESAMIQSRDLSIAQPDQEPVAPEQAVSLLEGMEKNAIIQALKDTDGNKLEAAKRLGIGRQTLYNKIKQYGIELE